MYTHSLKYSTETSNSGVLYYKRLKMVWKSSASGSNATNEWAVPVLRYFFGSVRWYKIDLVRIDRSTRRIRDQRAHFYSSAIERVNMPRNKGGRGISGAELTWEKEVVSWRCI